MDLSNVMKASFVGPTRLLVHSVEGFGKTTLAAMFPDTVFIASENGFPRDLGFAPNFVSPKTWEDACNFVRSLITGKHSFLTLAIDTWDWLDPLIARFCLDRDNGRETEMNPKGWPLVSIEDYGYGKGYIVIAEEVRKFLWLLDELQQKRGMHIVILSHSHVKEWKNPGGENFDRYVPKVHEKSARLLIEWAENVLFGYFEIIATKDDPKDKRAKAKGVGGHRRIVGTQKDALYDAKNRYNLPATIELKDPRALVPYLLGKHIKLAQHTEAHVSPAATTPAEPNPTGVPTHPRLPPPAGSTEVPKPSMHAQGEAMTQAIREKYEETVAAKELAAKNAAPPSLAENTADDPAVKSMLADARTHCGDEYAAKVAKWVESAKGDAKKMDTVFQAVTAEVAKAIQAAASEQSREADAAANASA